jgi:signal transduction histidine kinase
MRVALVTVAPMLLAAVLVMAGGERLARRETETRIPFDRQRLLDLADSFRNELVRLDDLYERHLEETASLAIYGKPGEAEAKARSVSGIRLIRVFREKGKDESILLAKNADSFPEIELEGRKRPLNEKTAVVFPAKLFDASPPEDWIPTSAPGLRIHVSRPDRGTLVAILIDSDQVRETTRSHLEKWLATPMAPVTEAGERLQIETPSGSSLVTTGSDRHGPAASVIPVRNLSGYWQIRAWDGLTINHSHDFPVLSGAALLAFILAASGFGLYQYQNRALKLAAERVSFVNRVSHELGTPLTNLSLNLSLATDSLTTRPAEARKRLDLVSEEIERLSRLVANVLTFSRRERDILEIKPVRCFPDEIILRTLDSFRPALERRSILIESDLSAPDALLLDPDALSQITGNLLSNIEKYAVSGKWLSIITRIENESLTVVVRDKGPGIPREARERIFAPFERVRHVTNEGASGTGLGLAIGRDLAQRMGGTLELIDFRDGACFRLTLPARAALSIVTTTDAA